MIRGIERRKIFNDDKDRENFIEERKWQRNGVTSWKLELGKRENHGDGVEIRRF